ncbi:MAG: T9SS type A sorting domain-containing protein [Marinilabiliaceae bacterium]|nr:T9SS type A sorting domain-containing protein [Marinilabiliaceae bacterium]
MKILSLLVMLFCISYGSFGQFSGSFNVGSGAGNDYATLSDAFDALKTNGINGPVIINIIEDLNQQAVIPKINGSSKKNTITLTSLFNNRKKLTWDASSVADNYILKLDSCSDIIIKNLAFEPLNINIYGSALVLNGIKENITIDSCFFYRSNTYGAAIAINAPGLDSVFVVNNKFENGAVALTVNGSTGFNVDHLIVKDNYFLNQSGYSIYMAKTAYCNIADNKFESTMFFNSKSGILASNAYYYNIERNKFFFKNGKGLILRYCGIDTSYLVNNIVYIEGSKNHGDDIAVEFENGAKQFVLHNSFVVGDSALESSAALAFPVASGTGTNNTIENNNIVNFSGGYAVKVIDQDANSIISCDYNNLFVTSDAFAIYHTDTLKTMAQWLSSSPFDDNSVSIDPLFSDLYNDFYIYCATELQGIDNKIPMVERDFSGYLRMEKPTIGHIEHRLPELLPLDTVKVCLGETELLAASGGYYVWNYIWSDGDHSQFNQAETEGWLVVDANHYCGTKTDSVYVSVIDCSVGIVNNNESSVIKVFPNPVAESIKLTLPGVGSANVDILSLSGDKVYTTNLVGELEYLIDIAKLQQGVYILKVNYGDEAFSIKILKE